MSATAVAAVGLVGVLAQPAAAYTAPTPKSPQFGQSIDNLAPYQGQSTCSPSVKPGTADFRQLALSTYPGTGDLGIIRACSSGGKSEHKEGRAWDWAVNAHDARQHADATAYLKWLLATDKYGNKYANARRLGLMYMIYNGKIWTAYNADAGWRTYTGPNPHTDHVHFSLGWPGARQQTTWWSARLTGASVTPECPSPAAAAAPTISSEPTGFVPVAPTRLLDTRSGLSAGGSRCVLGHQQQLDVQVLGRGGVPASGVAAVVLNVAGLAPEYSTHLKVFPTGSSSQTSAVQPMKGTNVASSVIVPVGTGGKVSVRSGGGRLGVLADVVGYFPTADAAGSLFHPVSPARALDTRVKRQPLAAGEVRQLRLGGVAGVPASGVRGVIVNVTVVGGAKAGHTTVFPGGAAVPNASSLNWQPYQTIANRVVSGTSSDGTIQIRNGSSGSSHVLVDVVGYFADRSVSGGMSFVPLAERRLLDTRNGTGGSVGTVGAGESLSIDLPSSVPAAAVPVLTLASVNPSSTTHLTAWPSGATYPNTSDVNATRTVVAAGNLVVVRGGAGGNVTVRNANGSTHLLADLRGYFAR